MARSVKQTAKIPRSTPAPHANARSLFDFYTMFMLCARVHIEPSRSSADAVSIFWRIRFKKVWHRARQTRPARVRCNHHQLGARPARPDPEGDLMNAFAIASHTFANGTIATYDTRAFDLNMYDESDAIMARIDREAKNVPSVPFVPFITDDGIAGYARAFARVGDNGSTAIICLAVSAYRPDGRKINKVTERLSIDVNPDTFVADTWEGLAKALSGFLLNVGGEVAEGGLDPLALYDLANALRG